MQEFFIVVKEDLVSEENNSNKASKQLKFFYLPLATWKLEMKSKLVVSILYNEQNEIQ